MYENRKYAIVDAVGFNQAVSEGTILIELLFENILESNVNTLRYNNDNTKFIIKSEDLLSIEYLRTKATELNIGYAEYTYEEILLELENAEWNPDIEELI